MGYFTKNTMKPTVNENQRTLKGGEEMSDDASILMQIKEVLDNIEKTLEKINENLKEIMR